MQALVYNGPRDVSIKNVPDAQIERPTDVLVKITTTNICGSNGIQRTGGDCRTGGPQKQSDQAFVSHRVGSVSNVSRRRSGAKVTRVVDDTACPVRRFWGSAGGGLHEEDRDKSAAPA